MKTPSLSENLCEFNRRQTSFVTQNKYDIYGSLYGGGRGRAVAIGFGILYLYSNLRRQI